MKYVILMFFVMFSTLDASTYVRSIRLGSFLAEHPAKQTLEKAQKFLYSNKEMRMYQEKYNFHFKIIKSNKYYIVVLEPITDKEVVQKLLDTLRIKYKSAYPKKIKPLPAKVQKIAPEKIEVNIPKIKKPVIEKKVTAVVSKIQVKQKVVKKEKPVAVVEPQNFKLRNIIIVLLIIGLIIVALLIIVLVLMRKISALKNENETMLFELSNKNRKLESKEKMLSHVSHELRNPIASVMGLSQLILENELPTFQKENVQNIEQSAEKALEIIDDILNISKINAGELRIENREFNINSMIEHVLSTTYLQAKQNNIDVTLEVENGVPANIIGDSLRLGQVLVNLLSNAIKFSKDGNINLKIRKKETLAQSIILEFSVIDDGIGMTQEQLGKIFKSYSQADVSTSREFGGTGLGLLISKELVEKMGGTIKVRSQKDVGTTFVFTIEVRIFDIDNNRHYHLPSKNYLNKTILIVENSNKNVIALLRAFRYFRYKTHVVPSLDTDMINGTMKYDVIVINQAQINEKSIENLQKMCFKNKSKSKIILTTYRFTKIDDILIDKLDISGFLKIPFTQQNVLDTLVSMYGAKELKTEVDVNASKEKIQEISLKKILVAEDNKLNHKVLASLLEKTGADISFVTNGQEVINLIKKCNKYNLILMDIEMPVVNGYDTAIEIRKDAANDSIPIIALSARTEQEAKDKALAVGMQGYITKPIVLDDFYQKIYDALSDKIEINIDKSVKKEDEESELATLKELGKFEGEKDFYKSLLRDFQTMYASSAESFNKMIREKKYKDAIMLARDLKDVSLNIGAYSVCESVASLEYELERQEYPKILKAFQNFEAHLLRLLSEIELYVDEK
ncbi:ATP-binding protein [Sulfurimonas sp.]|uniref:ATP-binding protein n=1 Tax=Sulfurimonas sp. TaxID=2022749 RepID=UPI00262C1FD2|nr:ATP-binding protein [Sulfurimonas sp.]